MELLIIGSGCLLGYVLNQNGKQKDVGNPNVLISPNNVPSGPLIYDSNRVEQVDQYDRNLAAKKHAEKVKQLFPLDYNRPVNIFGNDNASDYPARYVTDNNVFATQGSAGHQFQKNVATSIATDINTMSFDPQTGQSFALSENENISKTPMFRSATFQLPGQNSFNEMGSDISLLSGRALDMSHANMNPMFGKMIKQPSASNNNSQVLLEKFTGMPSTDDQGTYFPLKMEVLNPPPQNPENPRKANIDQLSDTVSRAQAVVGKSQEYITPTRSFRDLPFKKDVYALPPNIDQTRSVVNPKLSYTAQIVPGQKGSTRPTLPNVSANPYDLTTDVNPNTFVPNKSTKTSASRQTYPVVRNVRATQETDITYFTPPNRLIKPTDIGVMSDPYLNQLNDSVTAKMEAFTPDLGIARGQVERAKNTGLFIMKEPEKGFQQKYTGQPFKNMGPTLRSVDAPNITVKDVTARNTTGAINPSNFTKDNTGYKKVRFDLLATNKSINAKNTYVGQPHKDSGNGIRKQTFDDFTTTKEINQFSHSGFAKGEVPAHMSYEANFETYTNNEIVNEHLGFATGQVMRQTSDGGIIEYTMPKVHAENYLTNPSSIVPKEIDRDQFYEGLDVDVPNVEFGNHYNGGKIGNGEDGKRKSTMRSKQELVVPGRFNPAKNNETPEQLLTCETNLKSQNTTEDRPLVNRTQPTDVVTPRMLVTIKNSNQEALNPRMDPEIKITSDLFPFV
ncbi:hypothetical protein BDK51DRAFT_44531 [Blyttiomyces helicus]|uniref:Uncharacterized protein n=1 Tax=Blyttiomyces helicus TaxID=388810 RepID=A0A4P9WMR1_9FUNG|nr:hypothetical protein BDK51DRAFT_44531 [Blyttiomyces helicus]|eukprot:RKO92968.1 hypothetical protein BDK51DRAFT_44531 [Blyttiomyces helicus]